MLPTKPTRKLALGAMVALIGLYAFYLIVLNGLLGSKVLVGWINEAQRNVTLEYDSAYTLFPGQITAHAVGVRVQDSAVEFQLTAKKVSTWISLTELFDQTFEARGGAVEGAVLRLRAVRPLLELCTASAARAPPIPGLTRPLGTDTSTTCLAQVETAFPPSPTPTPKGELWRLRLRHVPAQLDEIWIEQLRLQGEITSNIDLWFWPTAELRIDDSALHVTTATLTSGRTLATDLRCDIELYTDLALIDRDELTRIYVALKAKVALETEVQSFGILDSYLSGTEWISFKESRGHLDAKISVDHGAILEGTKVVLDPAEISVAAFGHRASGGGLARWIVSKVGDERIARFEVGLGHFALRRLGGDKDLARGKNLGITLSAKSPTIYAPLDDVSLDFELETLKFSSLTGLNRYFPPGAGLRIESGTASLEAALTVRHGHKVERGRIHLLTDEVSAAYRDLALRLTTEVTVSIPTADLDAGLFGIDGTDLALRDGQVVHAGGARAKSSPWWAKVLVKKGTLSLGPGKGKTESPLLSVNVSAELASIRPLLAVYGADGRLPSSVRSYDPGKAKGTFDLTVSPERLILDRLELRAGALDLQANLHQSDGRSSGGLLIGYQGLRVGLQIEGKASKLMLLDPTASYYRRANERRAESAAN